MADDLDPTGVEAAADLLRGPRYEMGHSYAAEIAEDAINAYLAALPVPEVQTETEWALADTIADLARYKPERRYGTRGAAEFDRDRYALETQVIKREVGPWTPVDTEEET